MSQAELPYVREIRTAIDLTPEHVVYTQLGDLDTATDKARSDAPIVAVAEL